MYLLFKMPNTNQKKNKYNLLGSSLQQNKLIHQNTVCLQEVDESFLHGGILFIFFFQLFRNILLTKLIRASGLPHSNFIQIKYISKMCAFPSVEAER